MGYEPFQGNSFQVLEEEFEPNSIHAVVTDPPYGVVEFQTAHVEKMREGTGGVWRIPPELDGSKRKPLPRFTTLTESDKEDLRHFFKQFGESIERVLRPGSRVCGLYPVTDARGLQTTGRSWSGTSGCSREGNQDTSGWRPSQGCARPSRVQERLVDAEGVLGAVASLQKTVRWAS